MKSPIQSFEDTLKKEEAYTLLIKEEKEKIELSNLRIEYYEAELHLITNK